MAKLLRHRKGFYKGCYDDIHEKEWCVGEELTLKEVLDLWWNSVRILEDGDATPHVCYKNAYTCDADYELDGLPKSALKRTVVVYEWDYDADNYPIAYADFVD